MKNIVSFLSCANCTCQFYLRIVFPVRVQIMFKQQTRDSNYLQSFPVFIFNCRHFEFRQVYQRGISLEFFLHHHLAISSDV